MATYSKLLPPRLRELSCQDIFHPWTKNCSLAWLDMLIASVVGSGGFFILFYLFQYLVSVLKKNGKKEEFEWKNLARSYISSVLYASTNASLYICTSCTLRSILGKFHYFSIVFIPAVISGLTAVLEKRNRNIFSTAYSNLILQLWIRRWEDEKVFTWSPAGKTFVFMILSSVISYLIATYKSEANCIWVFNNQSQNDSNSPCCHKGSCRVNAVKSFLKYFGSAFFIELLKLIFSYAKNPKIIGKCLCSLETYKLPIFSGFYATIYQIVKCFLRRKEKKLGEYHDAIAGFLAGACFRFEMNITVMNSAIIGILQMLTKLACNRKIIPDLPYDYFSLVLCNAIMFHSRFYAFRQCPKLMALLMSMNTNKRADYICDNYRKCLQCLN